MNKTSKGQCGRSGPEFADFAYDIISNLITNYAEADMGYASQPRVQLTHDYGDYDHLARREEWMRLGAEAPPAHD